MRETSIRRIDDTETGRQERISTGIPSLDAMLREELPAGRTDLVQGDE